MKWMCCGSFGILLVLKIFCIVITLAEIICQTFQNVIDVGIKMTHSK